MSFLSGFAGGAAAATDDSLARWKQIFQEDERLRQSREDAESLRTLRERQAAIMEREFDWKVELEKMNFDWEQERFREQQLADFYSNVREDWPNLSSGERLGILHSLETSGFASSDVGRAYQSLLQEQIRDTMSPAVAKDFLFSFFNADFGVEFPQFAVNEALRALDGVLPEEEYKQLVGDAREWQTVQREGRMEEFEVTRWLNQFQRTEAEATVGEIESKIEVNLASAVNLLATAATTDAVREETIRNLELVNEGMEIVNAQEQIRLDSLPEQLQLGLRELAAQVRSGELSADLLEATLDDLIARASLETLSMEAGVQLTQEELRHQLATSVWRDASVQQDVELAKAVTSLYAAQEEAAYAAARASDASVEQSQFSMRNERLELFDALIRDGNIELLDELGMDLLEPLFGERTQGIIDSVKERTAEVRNVHDRAQIAALTISEADAEFARDMNETALRRNRLEADKLEFEVDTAQEAWEHRVKLDWHRADSERINADASMISSKAYARQVDNSIAIANANAGVEPIPKVDALNTVRLAVGASLEDLSSAFSDWTNLDADARRLEILVAEGNTAEIAALAQEHGFSTDNLDVAVAYMQRLSDNAYNDALRKAKLYDNAMLQYGHALSPHDFGLDIFRPEDRMFWEDLRNSRGGVQENFIHMDLAYQAIAPEIQRLAVLHAPALVGGAGEFAASFLFDALTEEVGTEKMEAAGILAPIDLLEDIQPILREYEEYETLITNQSHILESVGFELDLNDRNSLIQAGNIVNSHMERLAGALTVATRVPDLGFLGIGGTFSSGALDAHEEAIRELGSWGFPAATLQQQGILTQTLGGSWVIDKQAADEYFSQQRDEFTPLANSLIGILRFR
jgi:hypothetical protein